MDDVLWIGPYRVGEWVPLLLAHAHDAPYPPSRQGVYAVTGQPWTCMPWQSHELLYIGGGENILQRIGQLMQDLLGFFGKSEDGGKYAGSHSGGEKLWCFCDEQGRKVSDLFIGWASTSVPCCRCMERKLLSEHKGLLNKNWPGKACICPG